MRPLGPLLTLILFFGVFWAELPTGSLVTVAIATVLILAGIKLAALLARRMRTSSMIRRAAEVRHPPGPALRTVDSHHSRPFLQKFADGPRRRSGTDGGLCELHERAASQRLLPYAQCVRSPLVSDSSAETACSATSTTPCKAAAGSRGALEPPPSPPSSGERRAPPPPPQQQQCSRHAARQSAASSFADRAAGAAVTTDTI